MGFEIKIREISLDLPINKLEMYMCPHLGSLILVINPVSVVGT
jgi:hypothetical protein